MNPKRKWVVFTDLDGTLLDHHSYSFQPALPALSQLHKLGFPVVLNSSKTRAEMESLRRTLKNNDPFIVENGAALVLPDGLFESFQNDRVIQFAQSRESILSNLAELRASGYRFKSFEDFSPEALAQTTGLSVEGAKMSKQRMATEPMLWLGSDAELTEFQARLAQNDLRLVRGGRFYHVMGHFDKADGLRCLMALYQQATPNCPFSSVALGDSPNDIKMLEAADYAVIIKGVNSDQLVLSNPNVIRTTLPGPEGWNEAILALLAEQVI